MIDFEFIIRVIIATILIGLIGIVAYKIANNDVGNDPSPKWDDIKSDVLSTKPKYGKKN